MQRTLLLVCQLLISLLAADPGWSQSVASAGLPGKATRPPGIAITLPLHLYRGYLVVVEGSIGSLHKRNLLVDTGANPSVLDQRIAHELALVERAATVNLSNQRLQTKSAVLPSLQLGPIHVESVPVLAQDLSFLEKAMGCRVDALIGLDILGKTSFRIDYRSNQILFGPIEDARFSVPFESGPPFVTVRMELQNRDVHLLIDTGGPGLTLFRGALHDLNGLENLGSNTGINLGGQFQRKRVRVSKIALGQEKLNPQTVFIVDDQPDSGRDFDGLLGPRALQFREIGFDFEHQRWVWQW
jgi:predicted aspartyl protease